MFDPQKFAVLGGIGNHDLDIHVLRGVNKLGQSNLKFLHLNIDEFPDGEPDLRIPKHEELKDKHVLIFQSIYKENLKDQFLTLVWAAKYQYGAKSVTAIVPFMRFRRQDHKENVDEINRNLMFVHEMKSHGVDRLILCDIHSEETLKNCRAEGIEAWNVDSNPAYANHLRVRVDLAHAEGRKFFVYAPDEGSVPRAIALAVELGVKPAATLKRRLHRGEVEIVNDPKELERIQRKYKTEIIFDKKKLKGATVCMREDELSTGGTANLTGLNLKNVVGAHEVFLCATHPVCASGWKRKLIDNNPFDAILVGDTIPRPYSKATGGEITKVHMSDVIAQQLFKVMSEIE